MKRAKATAALLAMAGCCAVVFAQFNPVVLFSVPVVYVGLCALLWSRSERNYEGLAFGLQCTSYLLLAVIPGFMAVMPLVSLADLFSNISTQAYEDYVWGAAMGSAAWGLPAALIGLPILLGTEWYLKRSATSST